MRLVWATDIHLNFVDEEVAGRLCDRINEVGACAVLLGGDLAEAPSLATWLAFLDARLKQPTYFVLGNHDYYGGDVAGVRRIARDHRGPRLRWLPDVGVVALDEGVALVGHGGWGDARLGDFLRTDLLLNDYIAIRDLRIAGAEADDPAPHAMTGWEHRAELQQILQTLGDDSARTLRPHLEAALDSHPHVVVLTHVPPFREACWYQGEISKDEGLPGFTCKAMGDLLLESALAHPERRILVLCGHTHDGGVAQVRPNLEVRTGAARYTQPDFVTLDV